MRVTGCAQLLAVLSVLAAQAGADTLVHGVRGYACTAQGLQRFDSLSFDEQGRVLERGAGAAEAGESMRAIDAHGATLLPGLIDAHGHVLGLGHLRMRVDLSDTRSASEALERVTRYAREHPDRAWILGFGWNQELWPERRFPTAAMLDEVLGDRPVWLQRVDGHAGWANSRAMALAGVDAGTAAPAGGRIVTRADGKPSGVFVDNAMALIERHVPEPGLAEDREALQLAMAELVSLGLTGAHDAGIGERELALYRDLAAEVRLPLRIYAMLSEAAREVLPAPIIGIADDTLTVRSVKLYADGALGSRGAALLAPYRDDPDNLGLNLHTSAEMNHLIGSTVARGFQVNVHAIGDAANRLVIDGFELAQRGTASPLRNRIEHAQVLALEDIPRLARLGLVASVQPIHATSDMRMAEQRLDPPRLAGAYAWRRFIDAGVVLAAGSDFPVEPANPFFGIHAAVARTDRDGAPAGGWYPDQAMTREEALCAFTVGAAYAGHMEDRVGSLAAGQWADFILVDRDMFEVPAAELWKLRVLETWVGGKRVYRAAGSAER